MSFSTLIQDPVIRTLVQENTLLRKWHDALIPGSLFRADAQAEIFGLNLGETRIITGTGLIAPKIQARQPGSDPSPSTYPAEQWQTTPQKRFDSIDTDLPTSALALSDLLMRNMDTMGQSAALSLNYACRDTEFAAALSGSTFSEPTLGATSGTQSLSGTSGTLRVRYINGFTRARSPTASGNNAVRFDTVSPSNPLPITVYHASGSITANVVGYTPDTAGDERGPGVLSLTYASGSYTVNNRQAVLSYDRTVQIRVGGGLTPDAVTTGNVLTLAAVQSAVTRLRSQNVAGTKADGTFHIHLDPVAEGQVFNDPAFQRLNTSLPDGMWYQDFVVGRLLSSTWISNTGCPQAGTVQLTSGGFYSTQDPIPVILQNASGVNLSHSLVIGDGALYEYYIPLDAVLSTPAGFTGVVQSKNPIEYNDLSLNAVGIKFITRAPLNRIQDQVSFSWLSEADWVLRTDATSGDNARYKRVCSIESASV